MSKILKLPKNFDINDNISVVTGGLGLLGMQHCEALLEIGSKVIIADIKKVNDCIDQITLLKKQFGKNNVEYFSLDVSSETSIINTLEYIKEKYNRLDILINNAAIDPKVINNNLVNNSRVENFSLSQWNNELNVGLTGAFLCSKIFGSYMANNNKGVILNISSDLSVIAPYQNLYKDDELDENQQPVKPITYSVIKTGLIGLTRYLASYWNKQGIRVNALSPGGVKNNQNDVFLTRINELIPLGRMARRDEYKSAVQFLCSEASSYMTGQNIIIDGGRSIW